MEPVEQYIHKIKRADAWVVRDKTDPVAVIAGTYLLTEKANVQPGMNFSVHVHQVDKKKGELPNLPHTHEFYEIAYVYRGKFINEFQWGDPW